MTDPYGDDLQHPSYNVVIQRTADGETRTHHSTSEWSEGSWFWWTDGNAGCDCNRALTFLRAGGENPATDDERVNCGETAYKVLKFIFPDGTEIPGPDAESP